ncbi:hypothetical protein HYV12_02990 [Candidatus Dojkabacteria bacterium]|nr:hypothetical protein [Candidatus Dojkabacteria bacterium]
MGIPTFESTAISLNDAVLKFVPIEHLGSEDYRGMKGALGEIREYLETYPNELKGPSIIGDKNFRNIVEDIAGGKSEYFTKLYAFATKYPKQEIKDLKRDEFNMVIEIETRNPGEAIRIGRMNPATFSGESDSKTYGIAYVKDGKVISGIAASPRTGGYLGTSVGAEITIKE